MIGNALCLGTLRLLQRAGGAPTHLSLLTTQLSTSPHAPLDRNFHARAHASAMLQVVSGLLALLIGVGFILIKACNIDVGPLNLSEIKERVTEFLDTNDDGCASRLAVGACACLRVPFLLWPCCCRGPERIPPM